MGYCYTKSGSLVCDLCGRPGGIKRRCPFGWCPPCAACDSCHKEHAASFGAANHRKHGCEEASCKFHEREQLEKDLLAAGKHVRCSAMSTPHGVHVLFRNAANETIGYYMDQSVYNSYSLGVPTTPEDYASNGQLVIAPNDYIRNESHVQSAS